MRYECQICKKVVEERPPEWCPECGGHRVIFKRIALNSRTLDIAS